VNIADGYAYCAGGNGLTVFDVGGSVGAPDDIQKVGGYVIPDLTRESVCTWALSSGSRSVDIIAGCPGCRRRDQGGTPENPVFLDSVDFPPGCDAFCVAFSDQYAYVGTHYQG